MNQIEIREYLTPGGRNLFRTWLHSLDKGVRGRVQMRVKRLGKGNFGQDRHLGGGLHETKMDFGPGYRLYYGYHLGKLILLLCGGDKATQSKDIEAARAYWLQYQEGGKR